jgi:hypothetical protein
LVAATFAVIVLTWISLVVLARSARSLLTAAGLALTAARLLTTIALPARILLAALASLLTTARIVPLIVCHFCFLPQVRKY